MSNATASRSLFRFRTGLTLASRLRHAIVLLALALFLPFAASAEGIAVTSATLESGEDGLQLNADFDLQISQRLEEAVTRGVPLYFVVEFELSRPRWYWFDEKPVKLTQTYKITYTPLLRQYRLSVGNLYQNFTRFDEVKRVLARVRGWHVADKGAFKKEGLYQANLRMRLDTGQLPKPFQLNAVASTDWALSSEWHRWTITP
jgi:ribosomal protein L29